MTNDDFTNYSFIRCLGNGTFGSVRLYRDIRTGQKAVIKTIKFLSNNISPDDVANEILIMSQLDHPRIIRFLSCFEDCFAEKLNIVMEYACGGTLHGIIERHRLEASPMAEKLILRLFCELLMGLDYLHMRNIIHCDLKPENVLLDAHMRVKIADFGISIISENPSKPVQGEAFGTPIYMAPEVYTMRSYSSSSDVWALGVVLYEMCTFHPPFVGSTIDQLSHAIHSGDFTPIPYRALGYDKHFQVIVKMMIQPRAEDRCTIGGIICLPFITKPFYETIFA
ncbi:serine/threonine-protein kinase Nek5-like [Lutzomyia longipalpis]|uniref:serine/threonine-protein kinase Nek5-like n=1 Tax=Lutzomyia longipalpis TaxID=7200 RepID=UPI002483FBCC|nr:serine/threonine-protein kinase Nek5-like [Lutzomyia longipalpis]